MTGEENLFNRIYAEQRVDKEEYFLREERTDHRHEWFGGRMRHLPLGNFDHACVCQNFHLGVNQQLPRRWILAGSNMRILVEETGLRTYADALLLSPETTYVRGGEGSDTATNPKFLAEVCDESTELYDRTTKWDNFQLLPSLEEFVLVSSRCVRVEQFLRVRGGWFLQVLDRLSQTLEMPSLGVSLSLDQLYEDVELPSTRDFWAPVPEGREQ